MNTWLKRSLRNITKGKLDKRQFLTWHEEHDWDIDEKEEEQEDNEEEWVTWDKQDQEDNEEI